MRRRTSEGRIVVFSRVPAIFPDGAEGQAMILSTFETSDLDEAEDYAKRVYDTRYSAVGTVDSFRLRHVRADHGAWASDVVRFESGGFRVVGEPCGVVSVCRLKTGRIVLTTGRDSLFLQRGDVFVMADAATPFTAEWSQAEVALVRMPAEALEGAAHHGRSAPGGSRFRILDRRPVTAAAGRRLAQVTSFAERHLVDTGESTDEMVREAVGHLLAASILSTFPNTLVPGSSAVAPRTDVPRTVAVALDFIARNADLPVGPADIAAHVLVTERALQLAFREHLGTSPGQYLRRYRLARVHEELSAASAGDGTAVTQVAARWTFTESSRFAAHYRRVYGELPSQTLRRDP